MSGSISAPELDSYCLESGLVLGIGLATRLEWCGLASHAEKASYPNSRIRDLAWLKSTLNKWDRVRVSVNVRIRVKRGWDRDSPVARPTRLGYSSSEPDSHTSPSTSPPSPPPLIHSHGVFLTGIPGIPDGISEKLPRMWVYYG